MCRTTKTQHDKMIQMIQNEKTKQVQYTKQLRCPLRGALADYFRKDSQDSFTMHSLLVLTLLQQTAVCLPQSLDKEVMTYTLHITTYT